MEYNWNVARVVSMGRGRRPFMWEIVSFRWLLAQFSNFLNFFEDVSRGKEKVGIMFILTAIIILVALLSTLGRKTFAHCLLSEV